MSDSTRRAALKGLWGASALLPLVVGQATQAQTPATPAPATQGPIPRQFTDPKTGRRVIRISDEDGSGVLYFYRPVYTPQGDLMVIKSPSGIVAVRLSDWKTSLLVKGKDNELLFMMRTTREAVYAVTDPGEGEA